MNTDKVLGWVNPPETFANRTLAAERTGMYSKRVSGGFTRPKASKKNPTGIRTSAQENLMCRANQKGFAPHMAQASLSTGSRSHLLHVLYREVPYILYITACPRSGHPPQGLHKESANGLPE